MENQLTAISTTYLKSTKAKDPIALVSEAHSLKHSPAADQPSPQDGTHLNDTFLEILQSEPSVDQVIEVLSSLNNPDPGKDDFKIHAPSVKSAAVVQALTRDIIPNYWDQLEEHTVESRAQNGIRKETPPGSLLLLKCFQSVTGINTLQNRLVVFTRSEEPMLGSRISQQESMELYLRVLGRVLEGDLTIQLLLSNSLRGCDDEMKKKVQAQTLLSLLAGGRMVSLAAQIDHTLQASQNNPPRSRSWIADGVKYSQWLGRNLAVWAKQQPSPPETEFCSNLFHRALSLGYCENLINPLISELLLSGQGDPELFGSLCFQKLTGTQKTFPQLLKFLSTRYLNTTGLSDSKLPSLVSAAAYVIKTAMGTKEFPNRFLVQWCTSPMGAGVGDSSGIRRAVLAVLAQDTDTIAKVFEKSVSQFGDELYMKHTAIMRQEAHAQIILLSAGYLHRASPLKFSIKMRSGQYPTTISKRIAASSTRVRVLGLVVAEALSALVDSEDKRLKFNMEDTQTEDSVWLAQHCHIQDHIGPLDALLSKRIDDAPASTFTPVPKPSRKQQKAMSALENKVKSALIIEEIEEDGEEAQDDLMALPKGPDPEDSDDDPTMVQRDKVKAPVYIRDLISYLRASDTYDKQAIALRTAPGLIRRKGTFGSELEAHAQELASLLAGMNDNFEIEDFGELKLDSLVALAVSIPKVMAPWLARSFFEGDYSLSQRTTILISLGVSAREMAGITKSEYEEASKFPSKKLPAKIEARFQDPSEPSRRIESEALKKLPPGALDSISRSITASFLGPLAASAADAVSGPDALKLQTVSQHYKSKQPGRPQVRRFTNTSAAVLAESFFSPLTAWFQMGLRRSQRILADPTIVSLYLQTLGIIIHAAGPSTLPLPQMTFELLELLLAVRSSVRTERVALRGWLIALASTLEVHQDHIGRLCEDNGPAVLELRDWVDQIFLAIRGEDGGEEDEVKMLAAGVLIKLGEAIEQHQNKFRANLLGE